MDPQATILKKSTLLYDEHKNVIRLNASHPVIMNLIQKWEQGNLLRDSIEMFKKPLPEPNISEFNNHADEIPHEETPDDETNTSRKTPTTNPPKGKNNH